jgi:hypothetical protein
MDTRGFEGARADRSNDPTEGGIGEATTKIGTDERRMHVRAYNHWVSLLKNRDYPSVEDLDPAGNADFGAHSVLLDFTFGTQDPTIRYLGRALREECALDHHITHISEVPPRSLLSRLTDHYLQIIANRAPIGFEAEFVGCRGSYMMYRGILMPFSSDGKTIDFVYGVINWKEVAAATEQAQLDAELAAAVRAAPKIAAPAPAPVPVWADGPSASGDLGPPESIFGYPAHEEVTVRLSDRASLATLALGIPAAVGELVVLVARAGESGRFDVLGVSEADPQLVARAVAALR